MDDLMATNLGMKSGKKTHRGRRSKGFGSKPKAPDPHAEAQAHISNASASTDPVVTKAHLFKALSSLKKC